MCIYRLVPSPGTPYDGEGGVGWDVNVHVKMQKQLMLMMMVMMVMMVINDEEEHDDDADDDDDDDNDDPNETCQFRHEISSRNWPVFQS